jgi:quercetin dioxygenase-like cupin family protein
MSDQPDRLRQHPEERFRAPTHQIDLNAIAEALLAEPLPAQRNHRQETLYRHPPVTVALFLFEAGAQLPPHLAEGVVSVHVLEGRIRMAVEGKEHEIPAGQILVMAPGVKHDVRAVEKTRMLLTVCLEPKQ